MQGSRTREDTVLKEEINKAIREELEQVAKANKSIYGYLDYMERTLTMNVDYKQYRLDRATMLIRNEIARAIFYLTRAKDYIDRKGISPEKMVEACRRIDKVILGFITKHFQADTLDVDLGNNKRESAIKLIKGMKENHKDLEQEINGLYELIYI